MRLAKQSKGFTLLEVLLVVGIITVLAAIVIIAINPSKQLGDAKNAQRRSDVNTILNAVYQYAVDNNGSVPATITTTETEVCFNATACTGFVIATAGINLHGTLVGAGATYLSAIPCDPSATCTTGNTTRYSAQRDATTSRITIRAKVTDNSATIAVTR